MKLLGLDIGSNSVGSAWIDTEEKTIKMGVSVFPAGVEEHTDKRGEPKNQARRRQRQQRRSIARRAKLKRRVRQYLIEKEWMPVDAEKLQKWENLNPWLLRRDAVKAELKTDGHFTGGQKFGRILLHLAQRRGAWWFDEETEEDEGKKKNDPTEKKGTVEYTKAVMKRKGFATFGELMACEYEARVTVTKNGRRRNERVRNRNDEFGQKVSEFVADRHMILDEFQKIWETQAGFRGELGEQLTDAAKEELYNKKKTDTWRCQGVLFSQRKAYWDLGTLGRCDLEPTDEKCPKADMYAQEFLVLTSVNNVRITPPGEESRKLNPKEREKVIQRVRRQKTASEGTLRSALGIDKGVNKSAYTLNTDDDKFTINGDWFYSSIACGVFGEEAWGSLDDKMRESVNSAILKFDPTDEDDEKKLRAGCKKWWNLDSEKAEKLIEAWKKRPKRDQRVNLSRRAIINLLPYLRDGWSVTEARDMFAEDATNGADEATRARYSTKKVAVSKRIRTFQKKHPGLLPPVDEGISNPVVRKSIHEVRKHLMEYLKEYGCPPDRVVIELAREARQTAKVVSERLHRNKAIDELRKEIIKTHNLDAEYVTTTQRERAIQRVRLCRQQRQMCAYSGDTITDKKAADGDGLEVDHIVPRSKGGNNGMSNLVLCYASANQGKGHRTPIDWLSKTDFEGLEQRFRHLKPEEKKGRRFITKDNVDMTDNRKWENLHRRTPREGFTEEQLSSSAYAARQVSNWINKVLYGTEDRSTRYVFASRGDYTGILRRDWGLFFDDAGERSEKGGKNRGDHRHHAVDAAVIAMTPQHFDRIKRSFADLEEQKEDKSIEAKREAVEEPWEGFSKQLAHEYKNMKVSHRAYNRQLAGYLHKDTLYGPAVVYEKHNKDDEKKGIKRGDLKRDKDGQPLLRKGLYVKSIPAANIKKNHLSMPDGWAELKDEYDKANTQVRRRTIRREMLALEDVSPGKSGVIRDIELRDKIRDWLEEHNYESIEKAKGEIKKHGLVVNGTPVRKVRLLWKLNEVVEVPRKHFDQKARRFQTKNACKSKRVYQSQNNHHIEIRQKTSKNGEIKWTGEVISNFEAARRCRTDGSGIVNRADSHNGQFVISLARGEIVHMNHPNTGRSDYFVVFKIDRTGTVHFTAHTDGNPASSKDKKVKLREDIALVPNDLHKYMIFTEDGIPEKVRISPLGEVRVLERD